ncbi:MAG: endonuclease/exonuclease/phosphatase family protein [Desulfobacterales bacterium]|nr:endonuclease/exonuclease/phosphatase family protein [Desulfobacterales bacterium]
MHLESDIDAATRVDFRGTEPGTTGSGTVTLRLLSYNIQTGITSERYRHYLTRSWRHVLPHASRWANLDAIAHAVAGYDLVALQEVDSGSLRTGFVNQTQYLADRAGFPFWHHQVNRRLGHFAQQSNGVLSRLPVTSVTDLKLPGLPGRGALVVRLGDPAASLTVFILHLALGKRARLRQVAFLADQLAGEPRAIVMGDLNCGPESQELRLLLETTPLRPPYERLRTFPSWQPRRYIDHILVSEALIPERMYVPDWPFSDHLPIAMDVRVSFRGNEPPRQVGQF